MLRNVTTWHYNIKLSVLKKIIIIIEIIIIQSNLDDSKCQGPPDFLRIIGSSNFQNRYFSAMFGSFRR